VPDALETGARLGSYEVIERLGSGGMGEVYRARDVRLGRSVAIKVLRPGADPELLHRLDREARAASALNHPNIVHIYDVGETGDAGTHYVVMELVEGETLRRRLRAGPLPMPELLDLGAQLADGLAKAHRAGIVHRDLKPENLMLDSEGVLKILDFGLAKLVATPLGDVAEDTRQTLSRHGTRAGLLMGTLEYMSPEQASGRPVDHRTDQFSLGLLLHEMATGRPAFQRASPAQVLAAVIERDPEPLDRLRPDVPAELAVLVARCLQKEPARRFERSDELAAALQALAGRSRAGARSLPPLPSAPPRAVSVELLPPRPPQPLVPAIYHVQRGRRIKSYDEGELAKAIRRGRLTGVELARRDDEEQWQPLYESRVYRREVPNPREAAQLRTLRGLGGHLTGFAIVAAVMYSEQANLPGWMAIWGVVIGMQALRAVPSALALMRRRPEQAPAPRVEEARQLAPPQSSVAQEAARVRALIEQRGGKQAAQLLADVDGILKLTADFAAREADLEEQTSEGERAAVAAAVAAARARVEKAELEQDRRLFERQLEVVLGREDAIAKARRLLERLRVRREVAEHQLKQLRLDLSRAAAAGGLDIPELSSRLQFIRDEVDAREEVAEIGAKLR
jgi:serine/threonine protein kinase